MYYLINTENKRIILRVILASASTAGFRGGSRIGTVELQHPLFPHDIIDNI
jgi:hypothetical protein